MMSSLTLLLKYRIAHAFRKSEMVADLLNNRLFKLIIFVDETRFLSLIFNI